MKRFTCLDCQGADETFNRVIIYPQIVIALSIHNLSAARRSCAYKYVAHVGASLLRGAVIT
jgi:hypothetical protein